MRDCVSLNNNGCIPNRVVTSRESKQRHKAVASIENKCVQHWSAGRWLRHRNFTVELDMLSPGPPECPDVLVPGYSPDTGCVVGRLKWKMTMSLTGSSKSSHRAPRSTLLPWLVLAAVQWIWAARPGREMLTSQQRTLSRGDAGVIGATALRARVS